jgi:SOS-response transcriptional repressor LexA
VNEDNGFSESPAGAYGRAGQDSSLVRLFGSLIDSSAETIAHESEEFSNWLAREIDGRLSDVERRESERVAQEAALRAHARIRAVRTGESLPVQPLRARPAATVGNASEVARRASKSRCAPWVESLAVAAGTGREIWDEPCERWVELPQHLGGGDHLALTVAGDSMTPWLRSGDVILVSARKPVTLDCIVVARRADNGYVVKHVTRRDRGKLELSSFNKEYAPFEIERSPRAIIGVVVAKLVRDEGADL